jgi:hypothetical protein
MANIAVSSTGVVSWLIPEIGDYEFTVIATNSFGDSVPLAIELTITTPSIVDVTLPMGIIGVAYDHTFTAAGDGPFTWYHVSGNLPPGISFNAAAATLSGSPSTVGNYNFRIRVTGLVGEAEEPFSITVVARPTITTTALNSGNVGALYSQTLQASGTTPIEWSIAGGMPPGLSLTGATISGTPTAQGTSLLLVRAQNVTGVDYADTKSFTLIINPSGAPVITTSAALSATRGDAYSQTIAVTSDLPLSWDDPVGLPSGITFIAGVLSGTPATAGVYEFAVRVANAAGSDSRRFTMTVADPPLITTLALPDGTVGTDYSTTLMAIGDAPISWQVATASGSETGLPPGLSLTNGVLTGKPTTDGAYTFRISAFNTAGSDTRSYFITIAQGGGLFIRGKEVGNLFIHGKEVLAAYIGGKRAY